MLNLKNSIILAYLLTFIAVSSASAQSMLEITLVEDPWPPYIEGQLGKSASGGTLITLYKEVFKQIEGVKVNYKLLPWKRALIEVEKGAYDGIMALFKSQERLEVMDFSAPIFTGRTMLWYSSDKFPQKLEWNSFEDLLPYQIVMLRGSAMGKPLLEARKNGIPLKIVETNNHNQQFEMISRGRGDITVLTEIVGYHFLQNNKLKGSITPMEKPLSSDDIYYMAFSKKSPARKLIPQINKIITDMQKTGQLDKILRGEIN